jgi:hypothetical protein
MTYMIHEQVGNDGVEQYAVRLTAEMEEQYKKFPNMYKKFIIQETKTPGTWEFVFNKKRMPFTAHKILGARP